jgi:hypothetical protein
MDKLKLWLISGVLGIVFSFLLVGGGWVWTSLNTKVDFIAERQNVRGERITVVEQRVGSLERGQIEIREYLVRIENKIDGMENERTGRNKRTDSTAR